MPRPTVPDLAQRELDGLPSAIRLGLGRLEITRSDAQDLLRRLTELAQAITKDFDKFRVHGRLQRRMKTYFIALYP